MATARSKPIPRIDSRSLRTRESIEKAALEAFSEAGFDAASTRHIAHQAGVKQQLITYHYGSKLELWKAVADRLFTACHDRLAKRAGDLDGLDGAIRIRQLIREFLLFAAENPALARFMMHEGVRSSPRLRWLFERHTKRLFELARSGFTAAQAEGLAPAADPVHLIYILLGATSIFSQAAEFSLVTGRDPRESEATERYIELVLRLILPGDT